MRAIIFLAVLLIVCAGCFRVATVLSPDAVGMAVGMLFGVLAGIPTALLMRGSNRCMDEDEYRSFTSRYPDDVLAAHGIQREPPIRVIHEHRHTHVISSTLPPLAPLPPYQPKRAIVEREELNESWMVQP